MQLYSVLNCVPGIFIGVRPDQSIFFVNRTAEEAFGFSSAAVLGKRWLELAIDWAWAEAIEAAARCMKQQETIELDGFAFRVAGQERFLVLAFCPIGSGNESEGGFFLFARDITQRKLTEQQLERTRHQTEAILSNIPDMAWLKDREGAFILVNEQIAKAAGKSVEEIIGKTDYDCWQPELARSYRDDDQEVMRSRRRKRVEEPFTDRRGKTVWIETIKSPIMNERGEVIGTAGIARDITNRKLVEDNLTQLVEQQELLDEIIRHSPAIAFRWSADPGWPVLYVSSNVDQLGYSPDDFLSGRLRYEQIIHPDDAERVKLEVAAGTSDEERESIELHYRIISRSGEVLDASEHTRVRRDQDGKVTRFEGLVIVSKP